MSKRGLHAVCAILLTTLMLSGCADPAAYQAPIQSFRAATDNLMNVTLAYFERVNSIDEIYWSLNENGVQEIEHGAAPQPATDKTLTQFQDHLAADRMFTPAGLAGRKAAFQVIETYLDQVASLANTGSGSTDDAFKTQIGNIAKDATTLGPIMKDTGMGKNSGNYGNVLTALGQVLIDARLEKDIEHSIVSSAGPLHGIATAVDTDLKTINDNNALKNELLAIRSAQVDIYNANLALNTTLASAPLMSGTSVYGHANWSASRALYTASLLDRQQLLQVLIDSENVDDLVDASQKIQDAFKAYNDSLTTLENYAQSPQKAKKDRDNLLTVLGNFYDTVRTAYLAVQAPASSAKPGGGSAQPGGSKPGSGSGNKSSQDATEKVSIGQAR